MLDRILFGLAALAALAYPFVPRGDATSVVVKVAMCVLLAVVALRGRAFLLAVALLFSAAGDAFLAIDREGLFVQGLASFLVTHVLYTIVFARASRGTRAGATAGRRAMGVVVVLFTAGYAALLYPRLGPLAVPVLIYIAAIAAMAITARRVPAFEVPLGAALFVTSDALIALGKFLYQAPWITPLVWATYALAQLLIVRGMRRCA